ncbi:Ger(x)C family spore germination protein [Bacillus salipaludis]|uniref:Ger(x)C family spore germination protein n=1 Tax=Bacillus salipaludis TaxID=2547811 RepID=UPI002E1F57BE|nr:Ger(x)C family spore germination protein [Bacillus salipaludis]
MIPFQVQNIKKKFLILICLSANLFLTGCWDRKEVNDMALVLGAAIDKDKGDSIKLSLQILIPRAVSSGQTGGGGGGPEVMTRSAVGENMADAASKLQLKFPRKIFWGHCKTFVIGKELAESGNLHKQIDFLLRHPEPRERAYLYVGDGEAGSYLKYNPPLERYTGEGLRKLSELHIGVDTTVKDFEEMVTGDAGAAILPLIKGKGAPDLIGSAIFKKDKMVGQINTKVTRGLMWLRNEIEVTAVTVTPRKGETIALDPIRASTKLLPTIKNGKWKILVKVSSEGTIVQNGSNLDVMSPTITKRVEKELEQDIKQRINISLKQVKQGMNIDAFGFADAFHRKYPKEWEKVKNHWDVVLPKVEVKININTRIRRPGLSTKPAGLKEEEVEKK